LVDIPHNLNHPAVATHHGLGHDVARLERHELRFLRAEGDAAGRIEGPRRAHLATTAGAHAGGFHRRLISGSERTRECSMWLYSAARRGAAWREVQFQIRRVRTAPSNESLSARRGKAFGSRRERAQRSEPPEAKRGHWGPREQRRRGSGRKA